MWDLGGQANLRPSWATYYTRTDCIILVSMAPSRTSPLVPQKALSPLCLAMPSTDVLHTRTVTSCDGANISGGFEATSHSLKVHTIHNILRVTENRLDDDVSQPDNCL